MLESIKINISSINYVSISVGILVAGQPSMISAIRRTSEHDAKYSNSVRNHDFFPAYMADVLFTIIHTQLLIWYYVTFLNKQRLLILIT